MTAFKVEMLVRGEWLWIILPPFPTAAEAQAWIVTARERDREATVYRIEKDEA